jgi:hypothetical protein
MPSPTIPPGFRLPQLPSSPAAPSLATAPSSPLRFRFPTLAVTPVPPLARDTLPRPRRFAGRDARYRNRLEIADATGGIDAIEIPVLPALATATPENFFSRYAPEFMAVIVQWTGTEAELRAQLENNGLIAERDYHLKVAHAYGRDIPTAFFRDLDLSDKYPRQAWRADAYYECQNLLIADANEFCEAYAMRSPRLRPELDLAADASASEVIAKGFAQCDGIVVAEFHSEIASKRFIADNLQTLRDHGVRTLFMEHLFSDVHQADLNIFFAAPAGSAIPPKLQAYLTKLDHGHMTRFNPSNPEYAAYAALRPRYGFTGLIVAAKEAGLPVVAIDCRVSYDICSEGAYSDPTIDKHRGQVLNYLACKHIAQHQSSGRWIALVGNSHANTFKGVPGIAEMSGAVTVAVNDEKPLSPLPRVRTLVGDVWPGMHLDVVMTMPLTE